MRKPFQSDVRKEFFARLISLVCVVAIVMAFWSPAALSRDSTSVVQTNTMELAQAPSDSNSSIKKSTHEDKSKELSPEIEEEPGPSRDSMPASLNAQEQLEETQSTSQGGASKDTISGTPVSSKPAEPLSSKAKTSSDKSSQDDTSKVSQSDSTGKNNPHSKKRIRTREIVEYEDEGFLERVQDWFLSTGLQLALIVALALVALKFTVLFSRDAFNFFTRNKEGTELKRRADTLSSVVRYSLSVSIIAIAGMMVLKELGIDIGPILAGAGVVGLAVGFGAQNLVKDVISGFFILLEDQIRVGDVVKLGDKSGVVERVTLRMVVLRDIAFNVHYIPNSEIQTVTNMTQYYSGYLFDIGVAYREDIDEVIEVMRKIDEELRSDPNFENLILEPLEVLGLQEFADSSVIVRARTKTLPLQQWSVGREFNRRLKKRFDELGIEIPFPHMTVYPGESKGGQAPDFNVNVQRKRAHDKVDEKEHTAEGQSSVKETSNNSR